MNPFDILTYSKLVLLPSAQRGEYHPWWGPGMMGSWGPGWMGWFGSVMHLLFWGLVVFVLFLLARRLWSSSQSSSEVMKNESPMDILKRRYASGEIDREEFENEGTPVEKLIEKSLSRRNKIFPLYLLKYL
jgi:putative membrane protein